MRCFITLTPSLSKPLFSYHSLTPAISATNRQLSAAATPPCDRAYILSASSSSSHPLPPPPLSTITNTKMPEQESRAQTRPQVPSPQRSAQGTRKKSMGPHDFGCDVRVNSRPGSKQFPQPKRPVRSPKKRARAQSPSLEGQLTRGREASDR